MTFPETPSGESSKARARRLRERFFEIYCQGKGLDIGCGNDPLFNEMDRWDKVNGDAEKMEGASAKSYDFVYCSHILEHLHNPIAAIQRWCELVKPGGYLIVNVPHRDLYEKKAAPPSNWSHEHITFWMPFKIEGDTVLGLYEVAKTCIGMDVISHRVLDEGYHSDGPLVHSSGEYSCEIILRKR